MSGQNRWKRWALAAKLILVPLGLVVLVVWISKERDGNLADGWNGFLLTGVAISMVSVCTIALRFQRSADIFAIRLRAWDALRIHTQSMFYFFFVPLSVGAEISKFAKLKEQAPGYGKTDIVGVIILDRMIGFSALTAIALVLFAVLRPIELALGKWQLALLGLVVLFIFDMAIALVWSRVRSISSRLVEILSERKSGIYIALAMSLVTQCTMALATLVGGYGWGIEINYLTVLFVLSASFICQAIPLTFVGVSPAEIAGAGLYVAVGLPLSDALILVSLNYFYRLLIAASGGIWELVPTAHVAQS